MNHFGLSRCRRADKRNIAVAAQVFDFGKVDAPVVIEGVEYLDAIMPVSSLTGNRMSIYEAMNMIGNEKFSRQLDSFLTEFQSISSDPRLSDDDRVEMLKSRALDLPCENERYRQSLMSVIDDFKSSLVSVSEDKKEAIKFDSNDAPGSPSAE